MESLIKRSETMSDHEALLLDRRFMTEALELKPLAECSIIGSTDLMSPYCLSKTDQEKMFRQFWQNRPGWDCERVDWRYSDITSQIMQRMFANRQKFLEGPDAEGINGTSSEKPVVCEFSIDSTVCLTLEQKITSRNKLPRNAFWAVLKLCMPKFHRMMLALFEFREKLSDKSDISQAFQLTENDTKWDEVDFSDKDFIETRYFAQIQKVNLNPETFIRHKSSFSALVNVKPDKHFNSQIAGERLKTFKFWEILIDILGQCNLQLSFQTNRTKVKNGYQGELYQRKGPNDTLRIENIELVMIGNKECQMKHILALVFFKQKMPKFYEYIKNHARFDDLEILDKSGVTDRSHSILKKNTDELSNNSHSGWDECLQKAAENPKQAHELRRQRQREQGLLDPEVQMEGSPDDGVKSFISRPPAVIMQEAEMLADLYLITVLDRQKVAESIQLVSQNPTEPRDTSDSLYNQEIVSSCKTFSEACTKCLTTKGYAARNIIIGEDIDFKSIRLIFELTSFCSESHSSMSFADFRAPIDTDKASLTEVTLFKAVRVLFPALCLQLSDEFLNRALSQKISQAPTVENRPMQVLNEINMSEPYLKKTFNDHIKKHRNLPVKIDKLRYNDLLSKKLRDVCKGEITYTTLFQKIEEWRTNRNIDLQSFMKEVMFDCLGVPMEVQSSPSWRCINPVTKTVYWEGSLTSLNDSMAAPSQELSTTIGLLVCSKLFLKIVSTSSPFSMFLELVPN